MKVRRALALVVVAELTVVMLLLTSVLDDQHTQSAQALQLEGAPKELIAAGIEGIDRYLRNKDERALTVSEAQLRHALSESPLGDREAWYQLAVAEVLRGRPLLATAHLQNQLAYFPEAVPEAHYLLGLIYAKEAEVSSQKRDHQRAREHLQAYLRLVPTDHQARTEYIWTLFAYEDFDTLHAVLEEGLTHAPAHPGFVNLRAITSSTQLPDAGPHVMDFDNHHSVVLHDDPRLREVQLALMQKIGHTPTTNCLERLREASSAEVAFGIGLEHFNGGSYDLGCAELAFKQAVLTDPVVSPSAWHQLGRVYFLQSKERPALAALKTQEALHGDSIAAVHYMLGLTNAFLALDHDHPVAWPRAEAHFRHYLTLDPHSPWAHTDLSWTLFSQEKYGEMLTITTHGLTTHPHHPWLLNMHGLALLNLDRPKEAKEYFARAQSEAATLSPDGWGRAYPGNDRRLYAAGLEEFRAAIVENLALAETRLVNSAATRSP